MGERKIKKFSDYWFGLLMAFWALAFFVPFLWMSVLVPMATTSSNNFPRMEDLNYAEGRLGARGVFSSTGRCTFKDDLSGTVYQIVYLAPENSKTVTEFHCGNSEVNIGNGACFINDEIAPYLGKQAKIGWYMPKSFWFYSDVNPQLVILEVDGKTLISYKDSKEKMSSNRRGTIYFAVIAFLFFPLISAFLLFNERIIKWWLARNAQKAIRHND